MTIEETQNPLVFVECMTFNHANYIEDAMKGFVMQQTEFPYVVSVMDDASTDGEPEVIKRFLEKEFDMDSAITHETDDRIRVVARHKTNENCIFLVLYLKYNHYSIQKPKWKYFWNWRKNAKYIAMCEGDDYWTDPYKLQKQVDFLEEHEDYSMCVNRTSWLLNNGSLCDDMSCCYENDQDLSTDEIIRYGGLYVNTVSTIYRNKSIKRDEFQWWKMADVGDYPLHIAASLRGKVRYFADDMSVYRYQCEGSWTSRTNQNYPHIKNEVAWLEELDEETNGKYVSGINFHLWRFYSALYKKRYVGFRPYWSSIRKSDEKKTVMYKRMIKDVIIRIIK